MSGAAGTDGHPEDEGSEPPAGAHD
jgi:hypothetical protein